jgi:hypothetical protein
MPENFYGHKKKHLKGITPIQRLSLAWLYTHQPIHLVSYIRKFALASEIPLDRQSSCRCAPTNQEHSKCNFLCFFIICQFGVEKVAPNEQGLIWSGESSKGVNELSSLAHMIHHRGQAGFDGRHIQISEFCAKNANHQADGLEWTP